MDELVYLHEVCLQLREWEAVNKMRLEWIFLESMKQITFNVFSCLLFVDSETPSEWLWLWLSPAVSRLSFSLSTHVHTHIHIVTIIVYYIFLYWQNRHRLEFQLKRLLVTQSWHFTDTGPRTGLYVCIVYWIEVNFKFSRQPLSTAPVLGPKVNPPVTLKPKLKSLPILSSVERLSEF